MTTLSPPLSSAVRVTLPLTPLPFCSTSFAWTVVSAAALIGRHSTAEAAANMSELRNLIIYPLPQIGSTLCSVTMSCPTIRAPDIGSRCPWTPKHLSHMSVLSHLYTMQDLHHGLLSEIACLRRSETHVPGQRSCLRQAGGGALAFLAEEQTRSARDHQRKGVRRHTGVRVHHSQPVTTRLPKLHKSGELA